MTYQPNQSEPRPVAQEAAAPDDWMAEQRREFEAAARAEGMDVSPWMPHRPEAGYDNSRINDYWHGWLMCAHARLRVQGEATPTMARATLCGLDCAEQELGGKRCTRECVAFASTGDQP